MESDLMEVSEVLLPMLDALAASDRETDGQPVLPEGSRAEVVRGLQVHLVWDELMRRYIQRLGDAIHELKPRHLTRPPRETVRRMFTAGLEFLDDGELARLALDPVTLTLLAAQVWNAWYDDGQQVPDAWLPAVEARTVIMMVGVNAKNTGFRLPPGLPPFKDFWLGKQ